jgi:rhamnulose-1-phosphate aldolase
MTTGVYNVHDIRINQLPKIDDILTQIGEAGRRLSEIGASEGAAGNISVCVRWDIQLGARFKYVETVGLPLEVPELAGTTFIVTGSGRRLREVIENPGANVGCLVIDEGGQTGSVYAAYNRRFQRLTSEFNSHLAVHYNALKNSGTNFNAVVHAQPPYLTYLSHIEKYQNEEYLNQRLLRWQPETILRFPEGIGVLPFEVPGSEKLMKATASALENRRLVIWSKHGVMARSELSTKKAADGIEYAEAAARYEYLNLAAGEEAQGLSAEEIRSICSSIGITQKIF